MDNDERAMVAGQALYQWRLHAQADAQNANIPTYEVDWFLQGVSQLTQADLSLGLYQDQTVPLSHSLDWLTQQWQRRLNERVPVQYLVGETPWRDLMLTVTPDVLIPRPETELIVEIAQALVAEHQNLSEPMVWADLGTGSGAIAIALAKLFPRAQILAIDISTSALEIAHHNAQRNGVNNIIFYQGNWFEPLSAWQDRLTGVVTNPPYIPSRMVLTLEPEVTKHEPHHALDGGEDGLNDIRHLAIKATKFLKPNGILLTEHMQGQGQTIKNLLSKIEAYQIIKSHPDLGNIDRFISTIFCPETA